jgi:hypothetical protein
MIAHLNAEIKKRLGADRLIQLTNYDGTQTTIKEETLDASAYDAIGTFRYVTGIEPAIGNYTHVAVLIKGMQYYLEAYKGRDSVIIDIMEKFFLRDCLGIRDRVYTSPQTNSNVDVTRDYTNDKVRDFSRYSDLFKVNAVNSSASAVKETI